MQVVCVAGTIGPDDELGGQRADAVTATNGQLSRFPATTEGFQR